MTQLVRLHILAPYVPIFAYSTRNIQPSPAEPSKQGSSIGGRQLDVRTRGRTAGLTLEICHSPSRKISILIIQTLDDRHFFPPFVQSSSMFLGASTLLDAACGPPLLPALC